VATRGQSRSAGYIVTVHDLKIWPEYFDDVVDGTKAFEIRKNDRDYKVGDELLLREWVPPKPFETKGARYTGRQTRKRVTYVLQGIGSVGVIEPARGLSVGYVVLGLAQPESVGDAVDGSSDMVRASDRA
jgi:Domain of unknown function (DUF3850)